MKLSNLNFNIVDVPFEQVFVDILNRSPGPDFGQNSGIKSFRTFGMRKVCQNLRFLLRKHSPVLICYYYMNHQISELDKCLCDPFVFIGNGNNV